MLKKIILLSSCSFFCIFLTGFFFSPSPIKAVRDGALYNKKNQKIGAVFADYPFFKDGEWMVHEENDKKVAVVFKAKYDYSLAAKKFSKHDTEAIVKNGKDPAILDKFFARESPNTSLVHTTYFILTKEDGDIELAGSVLSSPYSTEDINSSRTIYAIYSGEALLPEICRVLAKQLNAFEKESNKQQVVVQTPSPAQPSMPNIQSAPQPNNEKPAVAEITKFYSGTTKIFSQGTAEWYELYADGETIDLGDASKLNAQTASCLKTSVYSGQKVKIEGKFRISKDELAIAVPETLKCELISANVFKSHQLKLTDALHNKYKENETYAVADALLNATWKQVKANVSEAKYKQLLSEQRQWASKGRDEAASKYSASMSDVDAFTKAVLDRVDGLASIVVAQPMRGTYDSKYASFTAIIKGDDVLIEGSAGNDQGNTCDFDGSGKSVKGWITIKHTDMPDYYLLFTHKGAQIVYTSSESEQGCGAGVGFSDIYIRK